MPPVIAAALLEYGFVEAAIFVASYATAVSFALSYLASTVIGAVFGKPTAGNYTAALRDRTQVVRSSIAPRATIYGAIQTSGPLVFAGSTDKGSEKNKYLHLIIALAAHECDAIGEIYFNDVAIGALDSNGYVTTGKYLSGDKKAQNASFFLAAGSISVTLPATPVSVLSVTYSDGGSADGGNGPTSSTFTVSGAVVTFPALPYPTTVWVNYETANGAALARIKKHLGSISQAADADLMAEMPAQWTAAHQLKGIAYLYVRLEFDSTVFDTGIPNIKAMVRGKKVLDPRSNTFAWTDNYALCVNDYMRSPDGFACTDADIDTVSVITAANISDELVALSSTAFQPRYRINGSLTTDHTPTDNITQLVTAGAGAVVLAGGLLKVYAGAYDTPTFTLTESDLRGSIKVRPRHSRRDLFNAVKGTYVDGASTWQPVDFPMVRNSTYATQDGQEITKDVQLPMTTEVFMAQRLAKITLERSRQGITVEFPAKLTAFRLQAWDTVNLTIAKFGWTNKVFRVLEWKFSNNGGIDLVLGEEASNNYAWNFGEQTTVDVAPDTNLPLPGYVPPLGTLYLSSGSANLIQAADGSIVTRLLVQWVQSTAAIQMYGATIEVEYRRTSDTIWTQGATASGDATSAYMSPVQDGAIYLVRARLVSQRGAIGQWSYGFHKVVGKTQAPPNVSAFAVSVLADGTRRFSFGVSDQPVDVLSGGSFRIKYRVSGSGTAWASMTLLNNGSVTGSPFDTNSPPAGTYDFAIVAVDTSQLESATPAFVANAVIGTEPVRYGAATNLLTNSDFVISTGTNDGIGALYGWYGDAGPIWGRKYGSYNSGIGGAWVATGTESSYPYEAQMWQGYIPASAGAAYELSAFFGASRCQALIELIFMNSARGAIGAISDIYDGRTVSTPTPPNMPQLWCKGVAPSGTAYIFIRLRKTPTVAGQSQSFAWWNRIMLCDSSAFPLASRQSPTPWIDSGLDRMHGGGIEPLTVGTPQIANYAATDVLSTGATNFAVTYGNGSAAEQTFAYINYTASVSGPALLSITGGLTNTYHSVGGGGGPYYFYGNSIRLAQSVTGIASPAIAFNDNSASTSGAQILPISAEYVFDLVAGTTYTFSALIFNRTNHNDTLINSATLRMEAIKK